ncbi:MAG: ABC transporter ATP-binding protein [Myxococcales bacterium]|nr:ABC transporter ATP-binding protein [Myxococcales bacterium]
MSPSQPLISLRHVARSYRRGPSEVHALDGTTLQIEAGRFVAIMGPSGSGKSTLLNLISGIDRPTRGEVVVGGLRLDHLSEDALARWRARHVGLVFQFFNLMPVLSARENVELPLLLFRLSRGERRERAELALRIAGLEDRMEHKPGALSGGEQQRVAVARALVTDPDLIVADEPTGDLDAGGAEVVLSLLRSLRQEMGKTVVMVTHDPRAMRFVDQVFHIDKGRLLHGEEAARAGRALESALGIRVPTQPRGADPTPTREGA